MAVGLTELLPLVAAIQADRERDSSLAALAARVGLTPSHLQRVFARAIGESPKQVATRIAVDRAAAALVATSESILDIALAGGFESHEGFIRAFRRHLGMTPSAYRRRGLAHPAAAARHQDTVQQLAPCIGLFGARVAVITPRRKTEMSYTVTTKTTEGTPVLYMRRRIRQDQIAAALGELLPAVYGYAIEAGIPMAGPPFCRYTEWSSGGLTVEAGLPVAAPAPGKGEILAGTLPAGPAVSTIHTGPYDGLSQAHAAIESHVGAHGLKAAAGPWEVYLTDPGQVPDPAQWQTEVIWPLA